MEPSVLRPRVVGGGSGSHKLPGLVDEDSTGTFHSVEFDQIVTGDESGASQRN